MCEGPGRHERRRGRHCMMRKLGYLAGALLCLIGLFYFVLMLTR